jgi:T5SS/PEP-CTERM-associated repeat protein
MGKYVRRVGCSLAIFMLWSAWTPHTHAQKFTSWAAAVDGDFSTASNWTNGVPGANDSAEFALQTGTPYTVGFTGGQVIHPHPQYPVNSVTTFDPVTFAHSGGATTPSLAIGAEISVLGGQLTVRLPVSAGYVEDLRTLNVDGAKFTVTGNDPGSGSLALVVGVVGSFTEPGAHLAITDGGQVELTASGASAAIATGGPGDAFGPSEIDVDGSSSKLTLDGTGPLKIGDSGAGILKITNGGQVDDNIGLLGPNSYFAGSTGGYGQVTVDGATSLWTNRDHLDIGLPTGDTPSSLTLANGGTVTVTNQLLVTTLGRIVGSGSITAGSVLNQALIAPGSDNLNLHTPGVIHLTTSFSQSTSGSLQVQLAGTTPGTQYDQILINGSSSLHGNLNVQLADLFVPAAGNSFHILDLGTVIGAFGTINLPALPSGLSWDVSQLYKAGTISVVGSAVPGDYNDDGIVDAADYTVWRDHLGQSVTLPNDTTPGTVTQADYDFWKSHYGNHAGSGAGATAAVPEPASALLLFAAWLLLLLPLVCQEKHSCTSLSELPAS